MAGWKEKMGKRIAVGVLVVAFLAAQVGSGFVFADKNEPEEATILSFSKLEKDVLSQSLETGCSESDIVLPEVLKAKAEIEDESVSEGAIQTKAAVNISVNVTWKLAWAEARSGEKAEVFDADTAGTYRYRAVIPERYKVAEDCEIPVITVTVKERAEDSAGSDVRNDAGSDAENDVENDEENDEENGQPPADKKVKKTDSAKKGSARAADEGTQPKPAESVDEATEVTVTYNYEANGGTEAAKKTASLAEGENVDLSVTATKAGWTFEGWNTDADATQDLEEMQAGSEDITLYAIYKRDLEAGFYSGNSRRTPVKVTIYNNSVSGTVTVPALESRTGETAVGYTSRSAGASAETVPEVRAGESLTLTVDESPYTYYGIYEKDVTISYDSNGGGTPPAPAAQTAKAYTNIGTGEGHKYPQFTLAQALTRKGYAFSGWRFGSVSGTVYGAGEKVTVPVDTTFYADWTDNITPVFGAAAYNDGYVSLWNWIIRRSNLIVTVPVTEEGSGISTVTYEITPDKTSEAIWEGTLDIGAAPDGAAEDDLVSVTTENGRTEITVTLDSDFKGKITLSCEDLAGNQASKIIGAGGGIIVEDNAPEITFSAGTGSSLTDVNEGAVDISVHVEDAEAERVSGGIKEVSYTLANGGRVVATATVTDPDFGADMVTSCGFTVRAGMEGENILSVTATDNAGNTSTRQQTIRIHRTEPVQGNVELDTYQGQNAPSTHLITGQDDLLNLALSDEEKENVDKGLDMKILLSVEDATGSVSQTERELVEDNLGNYLLGQYLDISLFKVYGINSRNRIEELKQPIRIQITVPDSLKRPAVTQKRTYAVMRVHGKTAEFLPDIDSQEITITIETDRFSTYVLVYRDAENVTGPDTTEEPAVTAEPGTTEEPFVTEEPDNTEEPFVSEEPDTTKKLGATEESGSAKKTSGGNDSRNPGPETGDRFPLEAYGTLAAMAAILFLCLYVKRRKER